MARKRLGFDFDNYGPFIISDGSHQMPPGVTPTAKVMNIGNGDSYPVRASTSGNIVDMRGSFNHSSGDARVLYLRLYLEGSVGGDGLRAYTTVNSNVDTARGAHISLDFEATAGGSECSGLGTALTTTLHIPNIASWAPTGTYASLLAEIYSDGTNSDPAGMTELAFIRISNSGGTGKADVDTDAFAFSFQGFDTTKSGGNVIMVTGDEPTWDNVTTYIKIKIGATTYYLLAVPAIAVD